MRERYFGTWQGLTMTEIQEKYPDDVERWARNEVINEPTVEPLTAVVDRVTAALRDVADRIGAGGTAVLVTHGGAARAGTFGLLGWPESVWNTLGVLGNCRVADLQYSTRLGWQLRAHNAG